MRLRALAGAVAALAMTAGLPALAQDTASRLLGLEEAVKRGLEENLDLVIERYEPPMAQQQIRQATGEFDPLLGLSVAGSRQEVPVSSTLELQAESGLIVEETVTPGGGLTGKLITGTQYSLSLTTPVVTTNNPNRLFDEYYRPVLTFGLTQPLWRDFGIEVNLVRVKQAAGNERMALFGVEARMLGVIRDIETAYWTLHFAQQHERAADGSLALALDLTGRLRRLLEVGRATSLDVRQAEGAVEARRSDLGRARADLENARVQLRLLISPATLPGPALVAVDVPPEEGVPVDLDGKIALALAKRPEIKRQQVLIENLELEEQLALNNTHPRLDLIGSLGYTGLAGTGTGPNVRGTLPSRLQGRDTFTEAFNDFLTPSGNITWSLGARLQVSLGNNDALGKLEQTRLKRKQERVRLTLVKNQVSSEAQTAFHDMTAAWARVVAAETSVTVQKEVLAAQERQLLGGLATVRTVLEAWDALARAEDDRIKALTSYSSARSRLAAATTASLDRYRLILRR